MYRNKSKDDALELLTELVRQPELLHKVLELTDSIKSENKNESTSIKSKGKATRPVTEAEFNKIIKLLAEGFEYTKGKQHKVVMPNKKVALALTIEATTGLRISDVVRLTLNDFVKNRGTLEIHEKKTNKLQYRQINLALVSMVEQYAIDNDLRKNDIIIDCSIRNIQRYLRMATDYLDLQNIGTHSFRKYFATSVFKSTKDIRLLQVLLNHSSIGTTQRYLVVDQDRMNEVSSAIDFTGPLSEYI